ncbi:MAG: sigma-70 family RNA polymerase sigma factor [Ignavibacteriaceae bacterium]|jgi:RNA polymerase sigma-70 factor (ECF subfamily)|nr:sigma-70 family RNA polymerase sigma factor [Ignavibacteriaceae bacterium]MCW8961085.1 sigma-70 family RNA polymerase sigma factor [Ignavibacteriaceae bacterium]MCW8994209.1 sigma-70 family RNA polymerase sigma factor [Psychromonas sp.]MCW9097528.1 sigma-70 family RNA polymerase sigma factor [Ignavibacteriaceae bacterium]
MISVKFDYLVRQYKNRVFNYAIYMMKNQMDAEDITQEVLIRTWENINKFNFYASKGWMMRTTHNLCVDYLRRSKKTNYKEVQIEEEYHEEIADPDLECNPEKLIDKIITDTEIREAIERLPERFKSPFVLYELQEFKYKEISKILDVPLNTVKVNILRARKHLQKELKQYAKERIK